MNQEIKTRWLKALRSGEYEQGKKSLENDNKFCCIGVLAKVQGLPTKCAMRGPISMLNYMEFASCGMDPADGRLLAEMNDGGNTFVQIADYIEKNL